MIVVDVVPYLDAEFRKGEYSAAYSGFEARSASGVRLGEWLEQRSVTAIDVVGLATDHCVRATALDAAALGLEVRVLVDLCAGVEANSTRDALDELRAAAIEVV